MLDQILSNRFSNVVEVLDKSLRILNQKFLLRKVLTGFQCGRRQRRLVIDDQRYRLTVSNTNWSVCLSGGQIERERQSGETGMPDRGQSGRWMMRLIGTRRNQFQASRLCVRIDTASILLFALNQSAARQCTALRKLTRLRSWQVKGTRNLAMKRSQKFIFKRSLHSAPYGYSMVDQLKVCCLNKNESRSVKFQSK